MHVIAKAEQATPTPAPWELDSDPAVLVAEAADNPLGFVAMVLPAPSLGWNLSAEAKANAEHIVACVNACAGINPVSIPRLVDALQMAEGALDSFKEHHPVRALHEHVRNVLKEARQDG